MSDLVMANVTSLCEENATTGKTSMAACRRRDDDDEPAIDIVTLSLVVVDGAILAVGLVGNVLVIYVVARYARMKTATNVYILNLSIVDSLFLVGMPMIMTTFVLRRWVFGAVFCRVFFAVTCVNMFTGPFSLTLMSADRFAAVRYPVSSARYRTPTVAATAITLAWVVSGIVMSPVVLYAEHITRSNSEPPIYSCTVNWPADNAVTAARAYVGYTTAIGFLLPVSCVCVFYALLVVRLRSTQRRINSIMSKRQPNSRRSVTCFVAIITAVFICCWLPYWCFQVSSYHELLVKTGRFKCYFKGDTVTALKQQISLCRKSKVNNITAFTIQIMLSFKLASLYYYFLYF